MFELPVWIQAIAGSLATAVITFFFTRRKYNAESARAEIENQQKILQMWQKMAEDAIKKVDNFQEQFDGLRKRQRAIEDELHTTRMSLAETHKELNAERLRNSSMERQINELKAKIRDLTQRQKQ